MICDRCGQETQSWTGSYFNTDTICMECDDRERAHPRFAEAKRIEKEQTLRGNYNFKGIGLPPDLRKTKENK
jgi:hypothetical protein